MEKKSKNRHSKNIQPIALNTREKEFVTRSNKMKVDTSLNLYMKNLKQQSLELNMLEDNMFEKPGSETSKIYVDECLNYINKYQGY